MPEAVTAAPERGFLLDGEWIATGKAQVVRSPYDQTPVGTTFLAGKADVERSVPSPVHAFEQTRVLPSYERKRVVLSVSQSIAARKEEFARSIALEAGK